MLYVYLFLYLDLIEDNSLTPDDNCSVELKSLLDTIPVTIIFSIYQSYTKSNNTVSSSVTTVIYQVTCVMFIVKIIGPTVMCY